MNTAQSRHAELAEPTELARSRREALAEPTSFSLEQSRPTVCVDAVGYGHWSSQGAQGRDFRPPRDSLWSDSDMSNVLPSPQTPGSSTAMRPPSLVSTPPPAVDIARRAHAGVVGQGRKDIEALRGNFDAIDAGPAFRRNTRRRRTESRSRSGGTAPPLGVLFYVFAPPPRPGPRM